MAERSEITAIHWETLIKPQYERIASLRSIRYHAYREDVFGMLRSEHLTLHLVRRIMISISLGD